MTVFITWPFPATGAPTAGKRPLPDRLSEIVNVKDWSAVGDDVANDTSAIQAAINYAMSKGGGTVFFPPGVYKCSNLTVGSSSSQPIILSGSSRINTTLDGINTTGYLISKGGQTWDNIQRIENMKVAGGGSGAGSIQIRGDGANADPVTGAPRYPVSIEGLTSGGAIAIEASTAQCSIIDTVITTGVANPADSTSPGCPPGSIGFALGRGFMFNCRATNYDIGYAISGPGGLVVSCSAEVNNTACRIGWGPSGEVTARGCSLQAFQTERCGIGVELYNCVGCYIGALVITGTVGPNAMATVGNMSWSATPPNPVTVTLPGASNIAAGTLTLQLDPTSANVGPWLPATGTTTGFINATSSGPSFTTFTYSPGPSVNPGAFVSGPTWGYPPTHAFRIRKVSASFITGIGAGQYGTVAGADLSYGGAATAQNNILSGCDAPGGYLLPPANQLAGWKFNNCSQSTNRIWNASAKGTPDGFMVFANLPGQGGVLQPGPIEGQEYSIIDSTIAASGNFAANITAAQSGGSNHVKVRWDGVSANWKISG